MLGDHAPLFIMILTGHVLCGCESSDGLTRLLLLLPVNVITLRFQSNAGLPTITDFTCPMRDSSKPFDVQLGILGLFYICTFTGCSGLYSLVSKSHLIYLRPRKHKGHFFVWLKNMPSHL